MATTLLFARCPGRNAPLRHQGGERHALAHGDTVHIPAKMPHSVLVPERKHITYVLVKFPGA
jgi:hypothetical protein